MLPAVAFCFAQNPTAQLSGTVSDVSGAAVPGAKLQITNVDTAITQETESNADGLYLFPFCRWETMPSQPSKKGSLGSSGPAVSQLAHVNLRLAVGSTQQAVEVKDVLPALETDTASTGQTIQRQAVNDLPLNGRNFLQLAKLRPLEVRQHVQRIAEAGDPQPEIEPAWFPYV